MKAGTASLKKVKDVGDYHMEIKLNNAINVIWKQRRAKTSRQVKSKQTGQAHLTCN